MSKGKIMWIVKTADDIMSIASTEFWAIQRAEVVAGLKWASLKELGYKACEVEVIENE